MNRRPEKPGALLKWLVPAKGTLAPANIEQPLVKPHGLLLFDAAWRRVEPALIEMIVSGDTPEDISNPRPTAMHASLLALAHGCLWCL